MNDKNLPSEIIEQALQEVALITGSTAPTEAIKDDDSGEYITITDEMRKRAVDAHGRAVSSTVIQIYAIKEIKEERLYLALGHTSFKTYIEQTLVCQCNGHLSFTKYQILGINLSLSH
jgi:hypothetical protein